MSVFRNFVFTFNNPGTFEYEELRAQSSFLIYGAEVGDNGTPHHQGYCELNGQLRFNAVKALIPQCHFEKRGGTAAQAAGYCCKGSFNPPAGTKFDYSQFYPTYYSDAVVVEHGTISRQGKRTDVSRLATQITVDKLSRKRLAEENPEAVIKFSRGIEALYDYIAVPRDPSTPKEVYVYWGATGTGKTRTAFEENPGAYMWGPENGKWFNGYHDHKTVIFDEYRGQLPFGFLLRLLDRYPIKVETKGGVREFVPDKIILTSPCPPTEWGYVESAQTGSLDQLYRRITDIRKFELL